jgi:DNA polymerase-1
VAKYMSDTRVLAKEKGYVQTIFGRRLWLPEINSSNGMRRQGAERAAINAPMQGTAADLIKLSMISVQAWLDKQRLQTQLLLQVHDELILEVPPEEVEIVKVHLRTIMTGVATLRVPLEVGIGMGDNWEEAH